jgi:cob(I)alamin adenosyltransferase
MEKIDEIISRVLELEKDKKELQDMIPWKAEIPRQKAMLDEITKELHSLRAELAELKAGPKKSELAKIEKEPVEEEGALYGFF